MKKLIFSIAIIVLLLCLFPYRSQCKDGGSVHYGALLYDVYDLHAIYDLGPDTEIKFVEGYIIEIFGIQVFNNTNPYIKSFGEQPRAKN